MGRLRFLYRSAFCSFLWFGLGFHVQEGIRPKNMRPLRDRPGTRYVGTVGLKRRLRAHDWRLVDLLPEKNHSQCVGRGDERIRYTDERH